MTRFNLLFLVAPLLIISGCKTYGPWEPPQVEMEPEWKEGEATPGIRLEVDWWTFFQDETLNELVEEALSANPNLNEALWRIQQAEAEVVRAQSFLFPTISFNPNTTNTLAKPNFNFGLPNANFPSRLKTTTYQIPFVGEYEVDLWGRLRYQAESAQADATVSVYAYLDVKLALETSVAQSYYSIRSIDRQQEILTNTIEVRQEAYEVNKERYRVGLANFIDVSQAETELENAKAQLERNKIMRGSEEHALAILLGKMPICFDFPFSPLNTLPSEIRASFPCEILKRRPDIMEAEWHLAFLFAQEGVAFSAFFPALTLSSLIGYQSPNITDVLEWQSRLFSLSVGLLQPVFDAGRRTADFEYARARMAEGVNNYTSVVLNAMKEVEDALVELRYLTGVYEALSKAEEAAATTRALAEDRYLDGLDNYLLVFDAERSLLTARQELEQSREDRYLATLRLIKALGGVVISP